MYTAVVLRLRAMLLYLGHATEQHPGLSKDVRAKIHSMLDPLDRLMIKIAHNRNHKLYCNIAGKCICRHAVDAGSRSGTVHRLKYGVCTYDVDFTYIPGSCCYLHEGDEYRVQTTGGTGSRACDFTTIKKYCARGGYCELLAWCIQEYRAESQRHRDTEEFWSEAISNCSTQTLDIFAAMYTAPRASSPGTTDYLRLVATKSRDPKPVLDWLWVRGLQMLHFDMFCALITRGMTDLAIHYLDLTVCWCGLPGAVPFGICEKHREAYWGSERESVISGAIICMIRKLHISAAKSLWGSVTYISNNSIMRAFLTADLHSGSAKAFAELIEWLKSIGAKDVIDLSKAYYIAAGCRELFTNSTTVEYRRAYNTKGEYSLDIIKWLHEQGVPMPHSELAGNTAFLAAAGDLFEWALSIGITPQWEHLVFAVENDSSALHIISKHIEMTPQVANKLLCAGILTHLPARK